MRQLFVWRDGKFIELDPYSKPKQVNAPFVWTDSMQAVEHPASGKIYESKSAFRRETKRYGLEEVGNSRNFANKKESISKVPEIEAALIQAKAMLDSGTAPLSEKDREVCKRINERIRNKV